MEMVINTSHSSGGVVPSIPSLFPKKMIYTFHHEKIIGTWAIGTASVAGIPYETQHSLLTHSQTILQNRLKSRLPDILAESVEARRIYPNPVQALIDLLASVPVDYDTWRQIIEEPYG
jgi:hypothetical protein